jgi:hypothetical protein
MEEQTTETKQVVEFEQIVKRGCGLDVHEKTVVVTVVGTKPEATFESSKRLAKWAGICPGNNESGGKKMSGRTPRGNKYLKSILAEAAWAATRSKGTYLRSKYDGMVGRMGKKKALLVIGHKILCAVYHILTTMQSYQAYSVEAFEVQRRHKRITYLQKELRELGVTG